MIRVQNINKSYHGIQTLSNISFILGNGQKTAVVGSNGVGKSTLLKILAEVDKPDSGQIEFNKDACVGYLPQGLEFLGKETIAEYVKRVTGIEQLEKRMSELEFDLADEKKFTEYSQVQDKYSRMQGYTFEHRLEAVLNGIGLGQLPANEPILTLSGGQKSKVMLAAILFKGVDVLLLDEPTNNLDLPALIWLEYYLRNSQATCLIVSHDRRFLDNVVSRVYEIDWFTRTLIQHSGSYSDYLKIKEREFRKKMEEYERQQEEEKRLKTTMRESKNWARIGAKQTTTDKDKFSRGFNRDRSASLGKKAKAIEKRLDQMEKIEKPRERDPFIIPLMPLTNEAKQEINLQDVVTGYPGRFSLEPISLTIAYGSRVAILGDNGSGKSTLLKVITGFLKPLSGKVLIGSSLNFGNLMQEHEDLPLNLTVLKFLREKGKLNAEDAYRLMDKFGFDAAEDSKLILHLSPGGRARLLLALFAALSVNVLVLDEPTNHLDLEAIEALENLLENYKGTVIIVSHDRYFLEKVRLNRAYLLAKGMLKEVPSYEAYLKDVTESARKMIKSL